MIQGKPERGLGRGVSPSGGTAPPAAMLLWQNAHPSTRRSQKRQLLDLYCQPPAYTAHDCHVAELTMLLQHNADKLMRLSTKCELLDLYCRPLADTSHEHHVAEVSTLLWYNAHQGDKVVSKSVNCLIYIAGLLQTHHTTVMLHNYLSSTVQVAAVQLLQLPGMVSEGYRCTCCSCGQQVTGSSCWLYE